MVVPWAPSSLRMGPPTNPARFTGVPVGNSGSASSFGRRSHSAAHSECPDCEDCRRVHAGHAAGDARAVAATFTVDGDELPPHHPAVKGRATIQQRYEAFFKGPVKMTAFAISPIESTIAGDVAYYVGTSTQTLLLPGGVDDRSSCLLSLTRRTQPIETRGLNFQALLIEYQGDQLHDWAYRHCFYKWQQ